MNNFAQIVQLTWTQANKARSPQRLTSTSVQAWTISTRVLIDGPGISELTKCSVETTRTGATVSGGRGFIAARSISALIIDT